MEAKYTKSTIDEKIGNAILSKLVVTNKSSIDIAVKEIRNEIGLDQLSDLLLKAATSLEVQAERSGTENILVPKLRWYANKFRATE